MALADDIIAAFKFDDDYADTFALVADLTASATPVFFDGYLGRAVAFGSYQGSGGSSSAYSTDAAFDISVVPHTFTGWFYAVNYSGNPGILSCWNNPSGGLQYMFWHDGTNLSLRLKGLSGTEYDVPHPVTPPTGVWTFFAFQFDPVTRDYMLQINANTPETGTLPEAIATPAISMAIGSRSSGSSLNGGVDAVHVFGRILDSTDIALLYAAGAGMELEAVPAYDELGLTVAWTPRDYRTENELSPVPADFPVANTTEYAARLIDDPAGAADEIIVTPWSALTTAQFGRTRILRETAGVLPSRMRVEIDTRHVHEGETFEALQTLAWDFDTSSADLADDENLGVLNEAATSDVYVAPDSGDYVVSIGTELTSGDVEYRLNGGAWTVVIAAGGRIGRILGVVAADDLEFRHLQGGDDSTETLLKVDAPVSTQDGYAVLVT